VAFTNLGGNPTTLRGAAGPDVLFEVTQNSNLYIQGLEGADNITLAPNSNAVSATTIYGGAGNDVIAVNGVAVSFVNGSLMQGGAGNDTLSVTQTISSSTVRGGADNDTLNIVNATQAFINGNLGNDTINIAAGGVIGSNTTIFGGAGADTVNVAAGVTLSASSIFLDAGNDTITDAGTTGFTSFVNSTVFGGDGNDQILLDGSAQDYVADGGNGNDIITLGAGDNTVTGGAGDDIITVGNGDDNVTAGEGADTVTLGAGRDIVVQGVGDGVAPTAATLVSNAGGTMTTIGSRMTFGNGIDQYAGFTAGADRYDLSVTSTAAIVITTNYTLSAILTAGNLFAILGTLTGGTFTFASFNGADAASGLVFVGSNLTLEQSVGGRIDNIFFSNLGALTAAELL